MSVLIQEARRHGGTEARRERQPRDQASGLRRLASWANGCREDATDQELIDIIAFSNGADSYEVSVAVEILERRLAACEGTGVRGQGPGSIGGAL